MEEQASLFSRNILDVGTYDKWCQMPYLKRLLERNRRWSGQVIKEDPDFFKRLAQGQSPEYLWIGCSDSRIPASKIVDLQPGQLFVHRNIANMVLPEDKNCQAVIEFAVDVLQVPHIIVCGHYSCGGVKASLELKSGRLDSVYDWLAPLRQTCSKYKSKFGDNVHDEFRLNRLAELNVVEQILNVCKHDSVNQAWQDGRQLAVHGWLYDLEHGHLHDLEMTIFGPEEVQATYERAVHAVLERQRLKLVTDL